MFSCSMAKTPFPSRRGMPQIDQGEVARVAPRLRLKFTITVTPSAHAHGPHPCALSNVLPLRI